MVAPALLFACGCAGHAGWSGPPGLEPRDVSTSLYDPPCGVVDQEYNLNLGYGAGDFDGDPGGPRSGLTKLSPGWVTLQWQESIVHNGSPFRISLSEENCEGVECFESCILLDHIPHDDTSTPCGAPPCTPYTQYRATVRIPNVYCNQCVLQLVLINTQGIKPGDSCTYTDYSGHHYLTNTSNQIGGWDAATGTYFNGRRDYDGEYTTACPAAYHSCANVFIDGRKRRKNLVCDQPADWPYRDLPSGTYVNGENATWTADRYLASPTPRSYNQRNVTYGIFDNQTNALVAGPYGKGVRGVYYESVKDAPPSDVPNAYEAASLAYQSPAGYLSLEDGAFANATATRATRSSSAKVHGHGALTEDAHEHAA